MLTDCSGEGRLRVCVEAEHAVDSPANKHLPGTFKLTVTGPLRLRGKDTLAADLRLHLDFDKGFRRWDGGDSVILGGGPAVFRACIRDVADSVLCDSVTVR
jgi:hypothetical protein